MAVKLSLPNFVPIEPLTNLIGTGMVTIEYIESLHSDVVFQSPFVV